MFQIKLKLRIDLNLLDAHAEECQKTMISPGPLLCVDVLSSNKILRLHS